MKRIHTRIVKLAVSSICIVIFSLSASAQSTDLNFPTAVTTNEINGTIKARDIGDSRLTSYFYTFEGGQGDVFINAVTKNFNGDIDVFAAEGLRPLTKMVLYADGGETETGRLVYLRKPERLVLRVEGRSPNDDPATFHIKFAGSFIAAAAQKPLQDPTVAKQDTEQESGIRVNSVGTIIEVIPKPQPAKEKPGTGETVAAANNKAQNPDPSKKENNNLPAPATATAKSPGTKTPKRSVATPKPKKNIATSKTPSAKTPAKPVGVAKNDSTRPAKPGTANTPEIKTVFKKPSKARNETVAEKAASDKVKPVAPPVVKAPDPLASIRLVVQLKDGDVIERPMSEIRKFSVDKGILTVIANDGSIVKYSILDVAKVTIQ